MSVLAVMAVGLLAPLTRAAPAAAQPTPTACILSVLPDSVPPGGMFSLVVIVISGTPTEPTGTATFSFNGAQVGSPVNLAGGEGQSEIVTAPAQPGTYQASVIYPGNADFGPCSAQAPLTVVSPDTDLAISTPANITVDATGPSGAAVSYTLPQVTDPDDATAPAPACSPAPGATFAIGTTTVQCTATDPDDTPSTVSSSFTVTVLGAADQLAALDQAVQGVGPGTSLADKITAAQSDLASGDVAGACSTLTGFLNEVKAQSGKSIPAGQAAQLIADATRIRAVLAC
jgi:Bacterial Ig-like domain (group 3)/HYR domain